MTSKFNARSVSVVIPTYNCAELLPRAIRSAYAQTIQPEEVIVVDDGCTDQTAEVVRYLAQNLPKNFIYEYKNNGGEASARNRGVDLATGDYVAFLDQDDIWLSGKLERQMALFELDPSLALTFTAYTRISGSKRELIQIPTWDDSPEYALRQLMIGCCITPSTVVIRRDVLRVVGRFDESLWLGCDWDMWLRIAAARHRIVYLPQSLTEYQWHTNNMSRDQRRVADAANIIFPRLFASGTLPTSLQKLQSHCLARWEMIRAEYCLESGDPVQAQRALIRAFHTRPASFRPGWFRLYWRSLRTTSKQILPSEIQFYGTGGHESDGSNTG